MLSPLLHAAAWHYCEFNCAVSHALLLMRTSVWCVQERARRAHQHEDNEVNQRAAAENALVKRMHKEADRRAVNKEISGEVGSLACCPGCFLND